MCKWLQVSASGFFDWKKRDKSMSARRRERLAGLITEAFAASDETYGYRRIHAQLQRWGIPCGPELVRDIMRELDLRPCQPRPWRTSLTDPDGSDHRIPDLLGQDFTTTRPGKKMVGDITYIPTQEGWLYLATAIDCYSKMVVGWSIADHYKTPLIVSALDMAVNNIEIADGCIFHSDRGSNYTSYDFAKKLLSRDMRQSVGRTGVCWDNAMAESFFGALKNEWINRVTFATRAEARQAIVQYIEGFYNRRRLHSGLAYQTPLEVHNEYLNRQRAA
jgi:transposase InsO family protein